jgi:hypothetical protein
MPPPGAAFISVLPASNGRCESAVTGGHGVGCLFHESSEEPGPQRRSRQLKMLAQKAAAMLAQHALRLAGTIRLLCTGPGTLRPRPELLHARQRQEARSACAARTWQSVRVIRLCRRAKLRCNHRGSSICFQAAAVVPAPETSWLAGWREPATSSGDSDIDGNH